VLKAQNANGMPLSHQKLHIMRLCEQKTKVSLAKLDATPIEELDKFRYVEAPARFSKKTGRTLQLADVQKLLEWKL